MGLNATKTENEFSEDPKRFSVSLFTTPNPYIKETDDDYKESAKVKQDNSKGFSMYCDLCFLEGEVKKASALCEICNGYMCKDCFKDHKSSTCKQGLNKKLENGVVDIIKEKKKVTFEPNVLSVKDPDKKGPLKVDLKLSGKLQKEITFSVKEKDDTKQPWICGMVAPSDKELVLIDGRNHSIKIVDTLAQRVVSNFKLDSEPFDICLISKYEIAVTFPEIQRIKTMTILNGIALTRRMKVKGHCFGITYRNDLFGVTYLCPEKVEIITLNGTVLHRIRPNVGETDLLNMPYYVTFSLSGKSLYVSDHRNSSVTRLSHTGRIMSMYKDGSLIHPESLVIVDDGSLLVVSRDNNCIHRISEDCERKEIILTRADGLLLPWALCFEPIKSILYVSNKEGQDMSFYCNNFPVPEKTSKVPSEITLSF
ncbi:hypothetical protein ACF0H5_019264 [Mactra antiquata]